MKSSSASACRNLYRFVRLRLGKAISDREIARRWRMEWKSFAALKYGQREVPRVGDLDALARLLGLDPALVFEVARGTQATTVHRLIERGDRQALLRRLVPRAPERNLDLVADRIADAVFTRAARNVSQTRLRQPRSAAPDQEKRRYVRVPVNISARYRTDTQAGVIRLRALSRAGATLDADPELEKGTRLILEWPMGGRRRRIQARGVVVWRGHASGEKHAATGVEFVGVAEPDRRVIAEHVARSMQRVAKGSRRPPRRRTRGTKLRR